MRGHATVCCVLAACSKTSQSLHQRVTHYTSSSLLCNSIMCAAKDARRRRPVEHKMTLDGNKTRRRRPASARRSGTHPAQRAAAANRRGKRPRPTRGPQPHSRNQSASTHRRARDLLRPIGTHTRRRDRQAPSPKGALGGALGEERLQLSDAALGVRKEVRLHLRVETRSHTRA